MTLMVKVTNIQELLRLERFCLEQQACQTPEGRAAMKVLAGNYAVAASMAAQARARPQ
jgi:hypothetical protein